MVGTSEQSNLSEFQEVHDDDFDVQTATKSPPLAVKGGGMYVPHNFYNLQVKKEKIIHLYPVFYIPRINHRFLSVGTLLNQGLQLVPFRIQITQIKPA